MHVPLQIEALVELDAIRDAMVGLTGISGLSVEQRKRLTIAVELVANPGAPALAMSQARAAFACQTSLTCRTCCTLILTRRLSFQLKQASL